MRFRPWLVYCSCLFVAALVVSARSTPVSAEQPFAHDKGEAPDCAGEPCGAVLRGFVGFLDRSPAHLDSNGRSCADCHMPTDNFQLSPASVEARFKLLQLVRRFIPRFDDPLFRPIDADDFRTNGANATDFSNLRQNGLVRITMPLPPNIKLIDPATGAPSSETFTDVWRSVPTVNNVQITGPNGLNPWPRGPNNTGGYQLDARVTTLQEQALGAFRAHAEIVDPVPERLLDDIASFQRTLFSSPRVATLADAIRNNESPLPDIDPPLTDLEQQGKTVFIRACTQCHGGPSFTTAQPPVPRYQDIVSACPRPVDTVVPPRWQFAACPPRIARNARIYEITANGATTRRTSTDPGRALLTGFVGGPAPADDWQKFDVPSLRGISKTAPYFHNNSAATLEEVVDHYTEFFKRVRVLNAPVIPPVLTTNGIDVDRPQTPEERAALLAYLRKL